MGVYIIVSASTANKSLAAGETLVAIAAALGEKSRDLERRSVPLVGEWDGQVEHSRAIRLAHPRDEQGWRDVYAIAYGLKIRLGQEAVMVLAERNGFDILGRRMARVFENVERVAITLPGRDEVTRDNLGTSTQTAGEPIISGVRNGSRWSTRADEHGTHVQAFV